MKTSDKHLEALRALLKDFDKESGDVVIGRMIPEFASLIVALSEDLDKAQRKLVRFTRALIWLTVILALIGAAQLLAIFKAP